MPGVPRPATGITVPDDAERDGSNFGDEKVTTQWPARRQRTKWPSFERQTVKAHVLAHVARSRRLGNAVPDQPAPRPESPEDQLETQPDEPAARPAARVRSRRRRQRAVRDEPRDLPLAPPPFARGSQTTPRIDEAAEERETTPAGPPEALAESPEPATDPAAASEAAMPPLYAGIVPYRHALPAALFELATESPASAAAAAAPVPAFVHAPAPVPGPAPAPLQARAPRRARRPTPSRFLQPGRPRARARRLPMVVFLLAVIWWSAAYWQAWQALSMTDRCRTLWTLLARAFGFAEPF